MPFLEHLEELRKRILISLAALIVGMGIAFWLIQELDLINYVQAPIIPYLPQGKLAILSATEGIMITFQLAIYGGLIIASPVILMQLWGFLSPALYRREKRIILPAILLAIALFLLGVWISWHWAVPAGIKMLMAYNADRWYANITFESYFSQVSIFLIALGLSMELPLVMTIFAWIGLFDVRKYSRFRRFAIVINIIAGAIIAPDQSPVSALFVAIPLIFLYELGVFGAAVVERRRKRAARTTAVILILIMAGGADLSAQGVGRSPPDSSRATQQSTTQDKSAPTRNQRLGIPEMPQRPFGPLDSLIQVLLERGKFELTRVQGDSADLDAISGELRLIGKTALQHDSATVEANQAVYRNCKVLTNGETQIFQAGGQNSIGQSLSLDICRGSERMKLDEALTVTSELGGDWFLRGNLAVDSSAKRLYMGESQFTTCDLPEADYHFAAKEVKWVGQSVLVARPAVLYVRDIPIMWLPFLFQDTKPGRRSGILIPQFGINDIVRPTRTYNRQVTNIGYYFAPSDYYDATIRADWYANRHFDYSVELRYSLAGRFLNGSLGYLHQAQSGGGSSASYALTHNQQFNSTTTLSANLNYSSNSQIVQANTTNPFQSVQQISSALNLQKRMAWGQLSLGGTRRQALSDGSGTMSFPTLSVTPREIALAPGISWSPSLSVNNTNNFKQALAPSLIFGNGVLDTLIATGGNRSTTLQLNTPLNIEGFNVRLAVRASDNSSTGRRILTHREPDPFHPGDSVTVVTTRLGDYASTMDWDLGVSLPQVLRGSWKLTPEVGITNVAPGPYLLRSAGSDGRVVHQGKRLRTALSGSPVFYGFINQGFGPVQRMRHEVAPIFRFEYSPEGRVSSEFAEALTASGLGRVPDSIPRRMQLSLGLSQNLSAKLKPPPGDTTSDQSRWRKVAVFSLTTSGVAYDFEQANQPGRTGWTTQTLVNTFQSGLIPGLSFSTTHDLWQGVVGTDTATFSPYLTGMSASVQLTGNSFRSILGILGLGGGTDSRSGTELYSTSQSGQLGGLIRPQSSLGFSSLPMGSGFTAGLNLSITRPRPNAVPQPEIDSLTGLPTLRPTPPPMPGNSSLGLRTSFSPTPLWQVEWSTQYNFTSGRFEMQQLTLQRDLHDWRATFNFQQSPNGNFNLIFGIVLKGFEQDIKFDYQQTTIRPIGMQ